MENDIELLKVEIDTCWVTDRRGRLIKTRELGGRPAPHLVLATSGGRWITAIGSEVPDTLVMELQATIKASPPGMDPSMPPPSMVHCAQILEHALGAVEQTSGPSYIIPPGTAFASSATMRSSGELNTNKLPDNPPPQANWTDDEWRMLLDGKLGPWALAAVDSRIVAICHSARLTNSGAEAGVWTDPEFRGQGHAAAATSTWASLFSPSQTRLFYSTAAANVSSQRVAARLNLRPIGWMWRIYAVDQSANALTS